MAYGIVLHVIGNLVWIGAILAVARVLVAGAGDGRTRGHTALSIYRGLAVPGFVLSFVAGAFVLFANARFYFRVTHFMHGKLVLALAAIALHHVLGAKAKKMADGVISEAPSAQTLAATIAVCAAGAAALVLLKPF